MQLIAALLLSATTFTGTWTGTSTCTGVRAACKDERVVCYIGKKKNPSALTVTMNKIVDGKEVTMGAIDMHVEGDTLTGDNDSGSLKSRWTFKREGGTLTGTAQLLPGGEVIRNVSLISIEEFCDLPAADGPIVVRGTILESNAASEHRPLVGTDEIKRLWVPVHVDELVKGSFLIAQGAEFRLAVHSIALSFGGDAVGEQYDIALKQTGNGYAVLGVAPSPASRMQVRGRLVSVTKGVEKNALIASDHPDTTLHLRTAFGEEAIALALPAATTPVAGDQVCILMVRRNGRNVPYRIVRLLL